MRRLSARWTTLILAIAVCVVLPVGKGTSVARAASKPNIVVIFLDDSGWADFAPFGQHEYPTPNVAALARAGCQYHNFYVPQAICSASRAALMTGCFPGRTKVFGAHPPQARGLDPQFATVAEVLKPAGYVSGIFGKWHLGDQPETRPPARGFDNSCGLMYSNDMWEFHPENPEFWGRFPLQFWENGKVTIERVTKRHQPYLTTWYTEHAVEFIQRHKDGPFFLYVPHSMPHVPIFCSDRFLGKSGAGLYGDVMMELDWSVGQIVAAIQQAGLTEKTLVVFTSDNGPWVSYGHHAGSTPFREAKGTGFDGGIRSACIMKFPGQIPAGTTSTRTFSTVDLLPTFAGLADARLRNEIDGKDVWSLITGADDAAAAHDYYPFSTGRQFEGVISGDGRWKLHLPHKYRTLVRAGQDGQAGKYEVKQIGLSLFDLRTDPYEKTNVIDEHPQIAAELQESAAQHKQRFYSKNSK